MCDCVAGLWVSFVGGASWPRNRLVCHLVGRVGVEGLVGCGGVALVRRVVACFLGGVCVCSGVFGKQM